MKIKSLLIGMLASTAFVACTNDESPVNNEQAVAGGEQSYIAVNLVSPDMGSRAAEDGGYKDGEDNEVTVGKVRFYFFDKNGNAYTVTDETYPTGANYIEPSDIEFSVNTPANDNVNSNSNAVLVINKSNQTPPASVVAVLNADKISNKLGTDPKSLSELTDLECSIKDGIAGTSENSFVMTNSVYKNELTGADMIATPISVGSICDNATDAKASPVNIYVERVLAKVTTTNTDEKANIFNIGKKFGGKDVFAKILGWGITNYNDNSNLLKDINGNANWTYNWWNAANDYRSFWANSATPISEGEEKYNVGLNNDNIFEDLDFATKYCLENTNQDEDHQTQLLVAAQLGTMNGEDFEALEIVQWMGEKYTVEGLKTQMANTLASEYFYYDADQKKYLSIEKDHIAFNNPNNTWESTEKRYAVNAVVASDAPDFFEKGLDEDDKPTMVPVTHEVISAKLSKLPVWYWTEGNTYYYLPIEHLGKINGVVRNHWYSINITAIEGFGTPVYDPKEFVLPQRPTEDNSYIAAQVNILSWKVVNQSVTLK